MSWLRSSCVNQTFFRAIGFQDAGHKPMNVIVFSKRLGRQIELGRPLALTLTIAVVVSVLAGVLFAGVQLGRGGLLQPQSQVADWGMRLESQRLQVLETKQELQNHLDALASRVGQMNAHVIRLDALGRRLTEMAQLDKGEFDFDSAPAVGGPEGLVEGALVTSPDIASMLDSLTSQIKDRERQLSVLESLISTRNLSRQIVPGGRPVAKGWISSYFGKRTDPFTGRNAASPRYRFCGSRRFRSGGGCLWRRDLFEGSIRLRQDGRDQPRQWLCHSLRPQ